LSARRLTPVPSRRCVPAPTSWERGALAAGEPGRLGLDPPPAPGLRGIRLEDPLRSVDPLQRAVADRDRAPRAQYPRARSAGDLLFERLTLPVGVEDAGDGSVSPVDDRHAGQEPRRLAEHDVLHAAVLRDAHVCEVRRARVDRLWPARLAKVPQESGVAVPLLEERGLVVRPSLLAERGPYVLELLDDRRGRRRRGKRPFEACVHLPEKRQLLLDDAIRHEAKP
jgi:hypothetical protein